MSRKILYHKTAFAASPQPKNLTSQDASSGSDDLVMPCLRLWHGEFFQLHALLDELRSGQEALRESLHALANSVNATHLKVELMSLWIRKAVGGGERRAVHFTTKNRRGEQHPLASMSNRQAAQLRAKYRTGETSLRELERQTGKSRSAIWRLMNQGTYPDAKAMRGGSGSEGETDP